MRHRRVERCLLRAEAALEAGQEAVAREAIAEATQLDGNTPDFEALRSAVEERLEAAAAAAAAETAAAESAARQQRLRRSVVAAGLGLVMFGASAAVVYRASGDANGSSPSGAAAVSDLSPSVPLAEGPPSDPGPTDVPSRTSAANLPITTPVAEGVTTAVPPNDAVQAVRDVAAQPSSAAAVRLDTPQVAATPFTSAPGGVASVPPPPPPPAVEERARSIPPLDPAPNLPPPAAAPAPAPVAVVDEAARVRSVLAQFERAYSELNATAAEAIWPAVDGRLLARAFQSLESQRVSLGQCALAIDGGTARADCDGTATWTPKIGGGTRTEARHWKFELQNSAGTWQIITAAGRNP